jgi:CRISPR-associated endonuclease/helicase Cas3
MDRVIYHYWGKARPDNAEGPSSHLLPYHCLDVAAVGVEYLRRSPNLFHMFTQALRCSEEEFLGWAAFWLALHDLGKFSHAFQSQKPELFEQWHGHLPSVEYPYNERHDSLGQWIWRGLLADVAIDGKWFGVDTRLAMAGLDAWMRAVTGHHGQPPKATGTYHMHFSRKDERAVLEFVERIRELLLITSVAVKPSAIHPAEFQHLSAQLSWWFAGIAVLADWLGSNTLYFPYKEEVIPLGDYWSKAKKKAAVALAASGVLSSPVKEGKTLRDFFPKIERPSPLQSWATTLRIPDGPQLYLLEDVTGAGKTEAAMMLAYQMMATGQSDGFYIGLPTMATANAMYQRIAQVYRQLFEGNPSLVLAHGSSDLVEAFASSVMPPTQHEHDHRQKDETASARCAAWLADHNKRALLSPAGVGTIDQVLLAVLHSRHQSLRLLGLYRKVLIVDEVHACDAYMQGVLEVLLEFHARSGGSAILLSATLTKYMKQALLVAYARGCGYDQAPALSNDAYPLATGWAAATPSTVTEYPLASRPEVCRALVVDYVTAPDVVVTQIQEALRTGQCVCWIRNTVADAIDAYDLFKEEGLSTEPILFHARFALADRLDREKQIIDTFGPESIGTMRKGRLVISTQVIEQSLDVDFDLVVSDLAPIDRLLQRAGRLCRHVRNAEGDRLTEADVQDGRGTPRLVVFGPVWTETPTADWFKALFRKAAAVYPDHGQLWLTARALSGGRIEMPGDARRLIESVFSRDDVDVPTGLQRIADRAYSKILADAGIAQSNTLKFAQGYIRGDVVDWWSDARTPSRLGDASRDVVLARWVGSRLLPWADRNHPWPYSTVRVPERLIQQAVEPSDPVRASEYGRVKEMLPAQGKWSVLLALDTEGNGGWRGDALPPISKGKPAPSARSWRYDTQRGLRLAEPPDSVGGIK